jgi:hypothetical protein
VGLTYTREHFELMMKRIVLIGAVALAMAACSKTDTVGTGASSTSSVATAAGSVAPSTTEAPATSAPKKTGSTKAPASGAMEPDTFEVEFSDGTKVEGDMSCSFGNKHLRLILEGFEDGNRIILDVDPEPGAETDKGEYALRNRTGGVVAKGAANLSASVYETTDDGKDAQGLAFSFSARFTVTESNEEGTVTGRGACIVDGGRIGGTKPAPGGSKLSLPVTNARDFAQDLITSGVSNADEDEDAFGAPEAWVSEGLPENALKGSARPATPDSISGFTTVADKGGAWEVYPFAVSDGTNCVFAYIYTSKTKPDPVGQVIDGHGECTGDAALESFELVVLGR